MKSNKRLFIERYCVADTPEDLLERELNDAIEKDNPQSQLQKISISEILMRYNVTPLAELVDDLEELLPEQFSREEVLKFLEWVDNYYGRGHKEDGSPTHWTNLCDLLSEEPLTTDELFSTFLSESNPPIPE